VKRSELFIYVTYSGIILLPVFIVEPGLICYWSQVSPEEGIDGRIPVVMGMAAKKSYAEHRAVKLNEITTPIPQPGELILRETLRR
jgi:hypothetical protein